MSGHGLQWYARFGAKWLCDENEPRPIIAPVPMEVAPLRIAVPPKSEPKTDAAGSTTGAVRLILRIEGLMVLVVSLVLYQRFSGSWAMFALWFLLPDVSFAGYFFGAKIGAHAYNAAHSYVGPLLCACAAAVTGAEAYLFTTLVWSAHIGFDRLLGYGLKYGRGFGFTHLGLIGRAAQLQSCGTNN